ISSQSRVRKRKQLAKIMLEGLWSEALQIQLPRAPSHSTSRFSVVIQRFNRGHNGIGVPRGDEDRVATLLYRLRDTTDRRRDYRKPCGHRFKEHQWLPLWKGWSEHKHIRLLQCFDLVSSENGAREVDNSV